MKAKGKGQTYFPLQLSLPNCDNLLINMPLEMSIHRSLLYIAVDPPGALTELPVVYIALHVLQTVGYKVVVSVTYTVRPQNDS